MQIELISQISMQFGIARTILNLIIVTRQYTHRKGKQIR